MIAFRVVLLPTPLRPSSATTSPRADLERDAVQDVALAVIAVDVVDLEQRLAGLCRRWGRVCRRAHVLR